MKRYRTTIFFLVVTLALFYVYQNQKRRPIVNEYSLYALEPDEIESITIEGNEKKRDVQLTQDILKVFSKPQAVIIDESHALNLASFGLNPPQKVLTIKTRHGESKILEFGYQTPVNGRIYVKLAGSDTLYAMPEYQTFYTERH